jgi:hypothetical protein
MNPAEWVSRLIFFAMIESPLRIRLDALAAKVPITEHIERLTVVVPNRLPSITSSFIRIDRSRRSLNLHNASGTR